MVVLKHFRKTATTVITEASKHLVSFVLMNISNGKLRLFACHKHSQCVDVRVEDSKRCFGLPSQVKCVGERRVCSCITIEGEDKVLLHAG